MGECDVDIKMDEVNDIKKWGPHCKTPIWNEVFMEWIGV